MAWLQNRMSGTIGCRRCSVRVIYLRCPMPTDHPALRFLPVEQRMAIVKRILHQHLQMILLSCLCGFALPFVLGTIDTYPGPGQLSFNSRTYDLVVIGIFGLFAVSGVATSLRVYAWIIDSIPDYKTARRAVPELLLFPFLIGLAACVWFLIILKWPEPPSRMSTGEMDLVVIALSSGPCLLFWAVATRSARSSLISAMRHAASLCTHCGYPLVNDEVNRCSECGELR